jgi:nucleoside-diphosphate-sugar epimerase
MRAGVPLRLVGGGAFLIHPIYVDDLAIAILDSIDKPAAFRQVFCIGGADVVTNADY